METRQAFQEHTLEELNGVIISSSSRSIDWRARLSGWRKNLPSWVASPRAGNKWLLKLPLRLAPIVCCKTVPLLWRVRSRRNLPSPIPPILTPRSMAAG
ncbi:MAG: hypothetical protein ABFQ82_04530 [Thermodesulfobacteriota bacterium]